MMVEFEMDGAHSITKMPQVSEEVQQQDVGKERDHRLVHVYLTVP